MLCKAGSSEFTNATDISHWMMVCRPSHVRTLVQSVLRLASYILISMWPWKWRV